MFRKRLKILMFEIAREGTGWGCFVESCRRGFIHLGHKVRLFNLIDHREGMPEGLEKMIDRFRPDYVFMSGNMAISELLTKRQIPYGDFVNDDPFILREMEIRSPYHCLFSCERRWVKELKDRGFEYVFYLPLAANPEIFKECELTREEEEKYECNISFVGLSKYEYYKSHYLDWKENASLKLRKFIDTAVKIQKENPLFEISDIVDQLQDHFNVSLEFNGWRKRRNFELGLEFAASALYRKEILKEVSGLGLVLYGDKGWLSFLGNGIDFRGRIHPFQELPKLYNVSKINLNVTMAQTKTSFTQRPFEVSACGGFVLSDYRRDLGELFEIGKEIIIYRNKQELRELVEYFLKHPEERREIARRARGRVLSCHTYERRMEELLGYVCQTFNL